MSFTIAARCSSVVLAEAERIRNKREGTQASGTEMYAKRGKVSACHGGVEMQNKRGKVSVCHGGRGDAEQTGLGVSLPRGRGEVGRWLSGIRSLISLQDSDMHRPNWQFYKMIEEYRESMEVVPMPEFEPVSASPNQHGRTENACAVSSCLSQMSGFRMSLIGSVSAFASVHSAGRV